MPYAQWLTPERVNSILNADEDVLYFISAYGSVQVGAISDLNLKKKFAFHFKNARGIYKYIPQLCRSFDYY